jgi:hypothetical protein
MTITDTEAMMKRVEAAIAAAQQSGDKDGARQYYRQNAPPIVRDYPLVPNARFTIDAGTDADLVDQAFGAQIVFDLPGVAERATRNIALEDYSLASAAGTNATATPLP